MVHYPQVQVGKILAGQVADGQAASRLRVWDGVVNDPVEQGQQSRVFESAA